jgi:predicted GTPase
MFVEAINTIGTLANAHEIGKKSQPLLGKLIRRIRDRKLNIVICGAAGTGKSRMIANRLESAMRLTVEIADRVETNLARKLELDLRIDDASSALDYYYSVVNLKSKSQSKSRKVVP